MRTTASTHSLPRSRRWHAAEGPATQLRGPFVQLLYLLVVAVVWLAFRIVWYLPGRWQKSDAMFGMVSGGDEGDSDGATLALRVPTRPSNATLRPGDVAGPPISEQSLLSCKVCGVPEPTWMQVDHRTSHEIYLAALATAAANSKAARRSNATALRNGRLPLGQRVRVQWSDDELHLGTVYAHKIMRDEINRASGGAYKLHTCVSYDINPTQYRPCHDLSVVGYELVDVGTYEVSPPPPALPPHGPPTDLRSCCFDGGSWAQQCGDGREHSWMAGIRGCNVGRGCPRCGAVNMSSGDVDLNCCNRGGSWYTLCGLPERGWAFSWKEGFRICNAQRGRRLATRDATSTAPHVSRVRD